MKRLLILGFLGFALGWIALAQTPSVSGTGTISGSGVVTIGGAGMQSTLQSITVSPSNPIIPYTASQGFTASGIYSFGSPQNLTSVATWTSSNSTVATNMGSGASFQCVARGTVTISATYQSVTGTTTLGCQSPTFTPMGTQNVTQNLSSTTIVQYTGSNGVSPFTFSSSGLPAGWGLSSSGCAAGQVNCSLIGVPSTVGLFNFFIQATDNLGNIACAAPGCSVSVNVTAAGNEAAENKYCTLVGIVETVTGLTDPGPANQLINCNYTAIASTSLTSPSGTGSGTIVYVCPTNQESASVAVTGCANAPLPSPLTPTSATVSCANGTLFGAGGCTTLGSGPFYSQTIQGAINFLYNSGTPYCGLDIQIYPNQNIGVNGAAQDIYTEPTVSPAGNINCGPDFGQPWFFIRSEQYSNIPLPGNRVTPAWVGQASVVGRPTYAQPAVAGIYLPQWRCEQPAPGGCTHIESNTGNIISGMRVMGIHFTSGHGRENITDIYGNPLCPANSNGTPQCSPGQLGPYIYAGCSALQNTNCLSPISGTVNTTNSSSGSCTADCVTWESWNAGVAGAEQYNFASFNTMVNSLPVGNPVLINGVQYAVCTVYSNTLMSVTTYAQYQAQVALGNSGCASPIGPGTQTGVTYTPYAGAYHVIIDRDLFVGCDDITTVSCYDTAGEAIKMRGAQHISVIDSYFLQFNCDYAIGPCVESHTLGDGTGEQSNDFARKAVNNYLEASGENIFTGGGSSLGYPADFEFRTNHLFKPWTWKVDNTAFVGQIYDSFLNARTQSTDYVGAVTCIVNPTDYVTTSSQCTAIVNGSGILVDLFICATAPCSSSSLSGAGYGMCNKGNGNTYACNPTFSITDSVGTWVPCGTQQTGQVNTSGTTVIVGGQSVYPVTWVAGQKFNKHLPGTMIKINGVYYSVATWSNNTNIGLSGAGLNPEDQTNQTYETDFLTRGDCVYPMIGYYDAKNIGELKNVVRMLWEGNIHENSWVGQSDQNGNSDIIGAKNANDLCPVCQTIDITKRYNYHRNTARGTSISQTNASQCGDNQVCLSLALERISDHDEVYDGMNGVYWTTGTSPISSFSGNCVELDNADSQPGANNNILINHITCIHSLPLTANPLSGGSMFSLNVSCNYAGNETTPAIWQFITFENSIAAGGVKNQSAHSNGCPNCNTNSCSDHSFTGSTVALNQAMSSSYLGTPGGGVYPGNILTAISKLSGQVNTSNGALGTCSSNCAQYVAGSGLPFIPALNGNLITISEVNYTATYIDANDVSLSAPPATQTNANYSTGAYTCSVGPTGATLSGGGASVQGTVKFTTGSGALNQIYPTDVGAGYTSTPTLAFTGTCTQPPVVEVQIGGQNNAGTSAWCFDSNAQPGNAWPGISSMEPPPTAQGDSASHNACAKPTGGNNLYTASGLTQWETLNFVNFLRDLNGAECSSVGPSHCFESSTVNSTTATVGSCPTNCVSWVAGTQFGGLVSGNAFQINGTANSVNVVYSPTLMSVNTAPSVLSNVLGFSTIFNNAPGSSDLHLCAGANNPVGSGCGTASSGHAAANDGLDIGANMDLVIGCDGLNSCAAGTPSAYTGIFISNGQLVIPQ